MAFGIDDAIAAGLKVLDKFIPDPEAREKAAAALRGALLEWDKGQLAVNAAEATHGSIFVAGWRPFIGWTCGLALAWQYTIMPLVLWSCAVGGIDLPTPPAIDHVLWELLFGMLGLGGLRTFEKVKGVSR
jgi:hypothetical protein